MPQLRCVGDALFQRPVGRLDGAREIFSLPSEVGTAHGTFDTREKMVVADVLISRWT